MPPRISATLALAAAIVLSFVGATRQRGVRPIAVVAPTFSKEVVRIFQENCQTCHRPGDVGPFSLLTYADAAPHAAAIKFATQSRQMPPWKPVSGCGDFLGERRLTAEQIETIARWADAGAPEGDRAQLPPPLDFSSDWTLGTPDLTLANGEPYTPPATGDMYRCFTMPANQTSGRWVRAIDIHPGDRETVHHVIAFIDTTGESATLDEKEPGPGYQCFGGPGFSNPGTLGGWAPGYRALELPSDVAFHLPANSRVVLQVHYHPQHGAPEPDTTEIAIYWSKQQPKQEMRILPLINQTFTIPPNDPNYKVTSAFTVPFFVSAKLWLVTPHMHLLGRSMKVDMTLPDGSNVCLINIDDWDFNWQGMYRYRAPIRVPPLARLSLTAFYDNSASNWRNPNIPPKPVSWGEATTDEMCIAFLGVTIDGEDLTKNLRANTSWLK